jgi:adenylate cyclase
VARRYEEALAPLKKALTRNPDFALAHLSLVVCYVELGQLEEARAEAAEVLRLNPTWSLESVRQVAPYKDPTVTERVLDDLRKAGMK